MRSEIQEPSQDLLSADLRRRRAWQQPITVEARTGLEPQAVDAALADESMPIIAVRGSRRDLSTGPAGLESVRRTLDQGHALAASDAADKSADAALLRSLAEQLDLLRDQQRQISRLLDQAGGLRIDSANS